MYPGKITEYKDTPYISFDFDALPSIMSDKIEQLIGTAFVITNNGDIPALLQRGYYLAPGTSVSFAVDDGNIIFTKVKVSFITGGAGVNPRVDIAFLQSSKFVNYNGN